MKSYISTIFDKFGLESRIQAAMYAARMGLVSREPLTELWPLTRLRTGS